ncbi:hypothetical protein TNCV_172261 [Trichonephila clavipes]|nr:hypothetical protein TNCV_172261 [Trichonephila clavipes]
MKIRVVSQPRQNDRLSVMLVQVHIAITPPHALLPVFLFGDEFLKPANSVVFKLLAEYMIKGLIFLLANLNNKDKLSCRHLNSYNITAFVAFLWAPSLFQMGKY